MKVAYLILHWLSYDEDVSINPKHYGASVAFARYCKEFENFHIFGRAENFRNLGPEENKNNCHVITIQQIDALRNGAYIEDIIPEIVDFNLICHCHIELYINSKNPNLIQLPWMPGYQERVNAKHKSLLLYNHFQEPILENPSTQKYHFTLGTKIPNVEEIPMDYAKLRLYQRDYAFFCGRICWEFCIKELVEFCEYRKIMCILAGPIVFEDYFKIFAKSPVMRWLGEISESLKIELMRNCKFYHGLLAWNAPFNLSVVQALAHGRPVIGTHRGFLTETIRHEYNGYFVSNINEFSEAYDNLNNIRPRNCHQSVLQYNNLEMIRTVFRAFEYVKADHG